MDLNSAGFGTYEEGLSSNPRSSGLNPLQDLKAAEGSVPTPGHASADTSGGGVGGSSSEFSADWYKAFFNQYNLPGNIQDQVVSLLKKYASDPTTAVALAQQYLRTTDWYQQTFPGFTEGVRAGLFTDETGYRGYLNAVNQNYNNYVGRHVSGDELKNLLTQGVDPNTVGKQLQGDAYVSANRNDIQYLAGNFGDGRLSESDLQAEGRQVSGLDTAIGQKVDAALSKAKQRAASIFSGQLARAGQTLGPNGLQAPGLGGTRQTQDVQA